MSGESRRDAAAVKALKPRPLLVGRDRDRKAAAAKVEAAQHPEVRGLALAAAWQAWLAELAVMAAKIFPGEQAIRVEHPEAVTGETTEDAKKT